MLSVHIHQRYRQLFLLSAENITQNLRQCLNENVRGIQLLSRFLNEYNFVGKFLVFLL